MSEDKATREQRLAEALRTNLRRRKAQARALGEPASSASNPAASDPLSAPPRGG